MKRFPHLTTALVASLSIAMVGCADNEPSSDGPVSTGPPATVDDHEGHDHGPGGHDHPTEGPHHGSLIELGAEEYHAEMVHAEESGSVTIYILDSAAKTAVPIEASEITINLKHDGKGEQFKLAAKPDSGDAEGKSSRFVSSDKELGEDLHSEDAEATLVLSINGKSYRGKIAHDHDHAHDHAH
ncbi:MAG: hypothetical protein HUJ26_17760 [Planctomycetaceae bacterium]|nr:hypothetical protein [Planctomycetaceae bacterium]